MGWTGHMMGSDFRASKKSLDEFFAQEFSSDKWSILASNYEPGGNYKGVYYAAIENLVGSKYSPLGEVWAYVALIDISGQELLWKDLDESCGPYEYGASATVLNKLTPTNNPIALEWRAKCRRRIDAKRFAGTLKHGDVVTLNETLEFESGDALDTFTIYKQPGSKTKLVDYTKGMYYRIPNWQEMIKTINGKPVTELFA